MVVGAPRRSGSGVPPGCLAVIPVLALASVGCSYSQANIAYRQNPDLTNVQLATGEKPPAGTLGTVERTITGWGSCDKLAMRALSEILDDARAMGGTRVVDAKFRQRFHWAGRPVCRSNMFGHKTVQITGLAVRE